MGLFFSLSDECLFGPECKYSHDAAGYLAAKPADLGRALTSSVALALPSGCADADLYTLREVALWLRWR